MKLKTGIENVSVTDVAAGAFVLFALEMLFEGGENRVCPLEDLVSSAIAQHPIKSSVLEIKLHHFTALHRFIFYFNQSAIQDELQDTKLSFAGSFFAVLKSFFFFEDLRIQVP